MSNDNKQQSVLVPVLVVGLIIFAFTAGILWQKVKTLEHKANGEETGQVAGTEENRLSVANLKKYAKDLGLDTKEFDNCLDSGNTKEIVEKELKEGQETGVSGTPGFFINGYLVSGALPFEMFQTIIDYELKVGFASTKDYPQEITDLIEQGVIVPEKVKVEYSSSPYKGAQDPKIIIVEYSEFQCPFCKQVVPTENKILETYPNDVRLIFKQFPLTSIHPYAQKAAEASLCAKNQGKFWEYHDKLFATSAN